MKTKYIVLIINHNITFIYKVTVLFCYSELVIIILIKRHQYIACIYLVKRAILKIPIEFGKLKWKKYVCNLYGFWSVTDTLIPLKCQKIYSLSCGELSALLELP